MGLILNEVSGEMIKSAVTTILSNFNKNDVDNLKKDASGMIEKLKKFPDNTAVIIMKNEEDEILALISKPSDISLDSEPHIINVTELAQEIAEGL